jgi:hypothetical protein
MKLRCCAVLRPSWSCCLLVASLSGTAVFGQSEQRWYEVEAIVFTHENRASLVSERPLADPARLAWLPRLRELQPFAASLAYPFQEAAVTQVTVDVLDIDSADASPEPAFGPQPASVVRRGFRLADRNRDPWIALDTSAALLTQDVQRLASATEHRVLWHATWRQPLLPVRQTDAVWVMGGDRYGERHEVEGSLRLSDSGGRVQLDAHLWFSSFLAGFASEGTTWTLPPLPAPDPAQDSAIDTTQLGTWMSSGAWQLLDTRLLTPEAYHYIDNPAIGLILQVRPYELPPRELAAAEADF